MLILSLLQTSPLVALAFIVGLVVGITIHEFSHALSAYWLGDPTAKLSGRLSLNPLAHLDPLGTLALLIIGIGWGKPTPFDPFNLRNVKRDSALISVSGAVSNILLAFVLSIPYLFVFYTHNLSVSFNYAYQLLSIVIWINLALAVFNLIPIHPLDGFKVLAGFMPRDFYNDFIQTERYGIFILIILLVTGVLPRIIFPITSRLFSIFIPGLATPF